MGEDTNSSTFMKICMFIFVCVDICRCIGMYVCVSVCLYGKYHKREE